MLKNILFSAVALMSLSACVSPGSVTQFPVQDGFMPSQNTTMTDTSLACARDILQARGKRIRIGVGQVKDYTGKFSNEASEGGFKITQGGSLMVMSALGKLAPAVQLIERNDTAIGEYELSLSKQNLVRDTEEARTTRPYTAGPVIGTDFYIVGGVTEANYNIATGGLALSVGGVGGSARYAVMNIAADLRIVNTRNMSVVKTSSQQKQVVGEEIRANVFRFFTSSLVDLDGGVKNQEPLQLGVRALLEAETLELISAVTGVNLDTCKQAQAASTLTPPRKPQTPSENPNA